jgi:hypothetical protein
MSQLDLFAQEQGAEVERSMLDELLQSSQLYHTSADYLKLLDFVSRLRNFAPFNAMLLQVQKPGLTYAASAWDWKTRFNRTIKEGARPLVILWPFAPVALVYDVLDTDGPDLPADVAQTFHAVGSVNEKTMQRHIRLLHTPGIHVERIPYGDGNAGHIEVVQRSTRKDEKPDYQVRINATHPLNVQFVTLIHELGHLISGPPGAGRASQDRPTPAPQAPAKGAGGRIPGLPGLQTAWGCVQVRELPCRLCRRQHHSGRLGPGHPAQGCRPGGNCAWYRRPDPFCAHIRNQGQIKARANTRPSPDAGPVRRSRAGRCHQGASGL